MSPVTDRTTCRNDIRSRIGSDSRPYNDIPCREVDPDLWFAETPSQLEEAKELCSGCPIRLRCLDAALGRAEPWGVWGGEIFDQGVVIARKRPRGRPRKDAAATTQAACA